MNASANMNENSSKHCLGGNIYIMTSKNLCISEVSKQAFDQVYACAHGPTEPWQGYLKASW